MSQVDYVIANDTHTSVRADLNATFAAIVTNNSGATEPTTTFSYQWWADTTTGILKMRNAANNAWISMFTIATGAWLGNAATATLATTAGTSGTFTISCSNFSTPLSGTASYTIQNGRVFLSIPNGTFNGTSNSTSFILTGLPAAITPTTFQILLSGMAADNGAVVIAMEVAITTTGTIVLSKTFGSSTSWTASGGKAFYTTELQWQMN